MGQKKSTQLSATQLKKVYRRALAQGISLDKLEAKLQKKAARVRAVDHHEQQAEKEQLKKIRRQLPWFVRYGALTIPVLFIGVGIFLVGNAAVPIAHYYTDSLTTSKGQQLIPPIPQEQVLDVTPLVIAQAADSSILGSRTNQQPVILDTELDYTNLSNWFDDDRGGQLQQAEAEILYTLDIPEIDVEQAEVKVGGTDLNRNLIAYPGTALPGELGAPVIFGHSVLRQFYNPSLKNPRRYNSIFSYIMTLNLGDEIMVTYQGAKYKYVVRDKTEVKPEDTYILAQQYDSRKLKLVTCVPEGTYLKRGVVTAELVTN